ncbi:MAG TPA: radical SAM protein [Acidimicrobiia bacterium]|nr:radical SAM protein [Acidimicrobiia bacterium]
MALKIPAAEEPLSVILKLPGETCNINCHYCYEKRKPYPSARFLGPDVLRALLRAAGGRPLALELHGGEPLLLGQARLQALLDEVRRYPGPITVSMQTNGTLLSDAWLDFFDDEWPDIEIGVSLDGDTRANGHRVDYRGRPTSDAVEAALRRLAGRGRPVGVISVVTRASLGRAAAIIEHFTGFPAVKQVKFAPCLDFNVRTKVMPPGNRRRLALLNPDGQGVPGWATTPLEYSRFLVDAFDAWVATGAYRRFLVEPLTSIIRALHGKSSSFCHFSESKCAHVLTLYPDGRLGSCDELSMPEAELASIGSVRSLDDITDLRTNPLLRRGLDRLLEKCDGCPYRPTCGGGCLATRLRYAGTPYDDEYCAYRMQLIDHVREALDRPEVEPVV